LPETIIYLLKKGINQMLRKGQKITEIKTGKTGIYLRKNPRKLSIDLVYVRWHGDDFESQISPTLLEESQFDYEHKQNLKLLNKTLANQPN
jgi:hypothetical protein